MIRSHKFNTTVYGHAMTERLTKSDWLQQGLETLASDGVDALKVGAMSQRLNVSRGSFYWHFRDIADFRRQLLQSWQEHATEQVIRQMEAENPASPRLNNLMKRAFAAERRIDRAIRSWAAQDDDVAHVVASVDARRVDYIAKLLIADGVERQNALPRATFIYWAFLGQAVDMASRHSSIATAAMDDITGLFSGKFRNRRRRASGNPKDGRQDQEHD